MKNSEYSMRQSILESHKKNDEYGKVYHVINDHFYTVVEESYFKGNVPYHSLYNTDDKKYGFYKVSYVKGNVIFD